MSVIHSFSSASVISFVSSRWPEKPTDSSVTRYFDLPLSISAAPLPSDEVKKLVPRLRELLEQPSHGGHNRD